MYAKLYQDPRSIALTDQTKYPCPSLPVPSPPFDLYENEPTINNREYYQSPPSHDLGPVQVSTAPQPSIGRTYLTNLRPSTQKKENPVFQQMKTPISQETHLLPVLDCRFNLREVCKQSILLEDHLSHEKKRCTDCCIKHFLALEGLCEEAVTLDQKGLFRDKIKDLAQQIRDLQETWYQDPDSNSHWVSQELRKIRKQFQIEVFPIIFEEEAGRQQVTSCSGGACRIKK